MDAINELRANNYKVYSIEQADKSVKLHVFETDRSKPLALVFGNEVYGVDQEIVDVSDAVVEIPQLGTKHSLNVSVSLGIVLWELMKGRMPYDK
jgi:tRNA G18 (ribose-2'-O)-methylase SpoU